MPPMTPSLIVRQEVREAMSSLDVPEGMGLIVRTAGVGRSSEELQWDLNYLLQLWDSIDSAAKESKSKTLLFRDSNVIIRALRDHLRSDIGEILIDNDKVFADAREFVQLVFRDAPEEYQRLLASKRFKTELLSPSTFNHGKLFVFAEFSVFRREFKVRFPDASPSACINAFSSLFLKNDISISNLVEYVEGSDDREQLRLNQPG